MSNSLAEKEKLRRYVASVKGKPYKPDFWNKIASSIEKENAKYEELESTLAPKFNQLRQPFAM